MKKKVFLSLLVPFMAFSFPSCEGLGSEKPEEPKERSKPFAISCSILDFTKTSLDSFMEGDRVGIYVYNPEIFLDNVAFRSDGKEFASKDSLKWYADETTSAQVIGYYPYRNEGIFKAQGKASISVKADQSTEECYRLSDFRYAQTTSQPSDSPVSLKFRHAMSKVDIHIRNEGKEVIDQVWLCNAFGTAVLDLEKEVVSNEGSRGIIRTMKNGSSWSVLVIPQAQDGLEIKVTTKSRREFRFPLPPGDRFEIGHICPLDFIIRKDEIATEISQEIIDWKPGEDINFHREDK